MDKTRICQVSTLSNWGGIERMLIDHLKCSNNPNIEYYVLSTSANQNIIKEINKLGFEIYVPPRKFQYDPLAIFNMARWFRDHKIHIAHTYNITSNCWGGISAMLANVPFIIGGERGTAWHDFGLMGKLERWLLPKFDLVIANSNASKRMLIENRKVNPEKIKVIYNGVPIFRDPENDIERLRGEMYLRSDEFVVGTIGRLDTTKNLFALLIAARYVIDIFPTCRFVIVGNGPLEIELKKKAESLGIVNNLVFTGWRNDARHIIHLFDIYVSTSFHESFGNTLVEAGLARKPVIAPNLDGIPEVISHNKSGILLEAKSEVILPTTNTATSFSPKMVVDDKVINTKSIDPLELSNAIIYLIQNTNMRKSLGSYGYKMAVQKFLISRYVEEVESIYLSYTK